MKKPGAKLIDPKKFGQRSIERPIFDADCAARAEQALSEMSGSFQQWLETEVATLQHARLAGESAGWNTQSCEALLSAAHDIKGLAATYDYPLVSKIAASLCRLIESDNAKAAALKSPALMLAHVDAIRAAVRDHIKTSEHPLGRTLLRALEAQVDAAELTPL